MRTVYAYVEEQNVQFVPDDKVDIANALTILLRRIAWFEGDQVGKLVQNYEFAEQNADVLNGFVKAGAIFFGTPQEALAWEKEFAPPIDPETGEIAWKEGVIDKIINAVKGWVA
jgi:hypothetical protein